MNHLNFKSYFISFGIIRMRVEVDEKEYQFLKNLNEIPDFIEREQVPQKWVLPNFGNVSVEINAELDELYKMNKDNE